MVRSGAAVGLSVLTWYEGSPSFFIWRGQIPEGLTVTAVPGVAGRLWSIWPWSCGGGCIRAADRRAPWRRDVRTADSVREGEVMVFCFREAELNWPAGADLPAGRDLLEGGPGECALYADSLGPERSPDL